MRKLLFISILLIHCLNTYGHHAIWQFMSAREEVINFADRGWTNAMDRPGAFQMGYLRSLLESRPFFKRVPDTAIIVGNQGKGSEHKEAFRGDDNNYTMIYLPVGKTVEVNTAFMKTKQVLVWWYNPKNGEVTQVSAMKRSDKMFFTSPTQGEGNDWVLVIDNAEKEYDLLKK